MTNNLRIGLEGYELLRIEDKHDLRVHVELRRELEPKSCPYCGAPGPRSKGRYVRRVRHLSCFGHKSELVIRTRRLKCVCCPRSFLPELPGLRGPKTAYYLGIDEHNERGMGLGR